MRGPTQTRSSSVSLTANVITTLRSPRHILNTSLANHHLSPAIRSLEETWVTSQVRLEHHQLVIIEQSVKYYISPGKRGHYNANNNIDIYLVFFEMSTCCASDKIIKVCKNLLLTEMFPQKLGDVLRIFHMTTPFNFHRLCPLVHSTVYWLRKQPYKS